MIYQELIKVPVPRKTDTYSPVSHASIIDEVRESLDKRNLIVSEETYNVDNYGKKLIGYFDIKADDSEMGMRLAFRNSYDKSMSVAFVAGSCVWICSNGMISGEIQYLRKHTGKVSSELSKKIKTSIDEIEKVFDLNTQASLQMKDIQADKLLCAELSGLMYMEHDLIKAEQLSILKKELKEPTFNYNSQNSLWEFYNNVTFSFKNAHSSNYIKQHVDFHKFIEEKYL
jgi:hypothetical protein